MPWTEQCRRQAKVHSHGTWTQLWRAMQCGQNAYPRRLQRSREAPALQLNLRKTVAFEKGICFSRLIRRSMRTDMREKRPSRGGSLRLGRSQVTMHRAPLDILPGGLIATHPKGQSWHLPIEVAMMRIALHERASGAKGSCEGASVFTIIAKRLYDCADRQSRSRIP